MKILLLISLIWLNSCSTHIKYKKELKLLLGHNINELINSWGYPSDTFISLKNGHAVYIYNFPTDIQNSNSWFQTLVEIDENNKIINFKQNGNDCISQ